MGSNLKSELPSKPKFGSELEALFLRLKAKGFMWIEIPWLVKDLFHIIGCDEHCTMTVIDRELEEMGWGIGVLDYVTYKLITSLAANNYLLDDEPLCTEGLSVQDPTPNFFVKNLDSAGLDFTPCKRLLNFLSNSI